MLEVALLPLSPTVEPAVLALKSLRRATQPPRSRARCPRGQLTGSY